jgi:predicted nucleic acid-binding protein
LTRFVLDNTVTMAWCFTDEANAVSKAVLDRLSHLADTALVPGLWLYEVVNVTELAVRKGRIPERKAGTFLDGLADLPIEIESPARAQIFGPVRALVARNKLSAYDASYLGPAIRHRLPLATFDSALARAAQATGVALIEA